MLTPCLTPLPDGTRLHRADLAVNCASASYYRARNTAIFLILIYPCGIPLGYFVLLRRFRDKIHPQGCDRLDAMQKRAADPELRPISFLFSCYSPEALYFEIFDSFRRIIMQGVLTFASLGGWTTGPAVIGIILALSALIVVREVAPYENPSTNILANIAQLQLLATCEQPTIARIFVSDGCSHTGTWCLTCW